MLRHGDINHPSKRRVARGDDQELARCAALAKRKRALPPTVADALSQEIIIDLERARTSSLSQPRRHPRAEGRRGGPGPRDPCDGRSFWDQSALRLRWRGPGLPSGPVEGRAGAVLVDMHAALARRQPV
jgi:hypothetical protein